ncbi:MAG: deoxyhypusine synthase [Phycisphaerae bacterium]|nr:deoxyhypusine synthase [Phycisphaerae bacterium]
MSIRAFINEHYRHFNAATVKDAAEAYTTCVDEGGHMLMTLAGAMSTGELGRSLAKMIRQDRVHAICCTGANLEEDLFNLVAHDLYRRVPHYRDLTPDDEQALLDEGLARVTDTCIPEEAAIRKLEGHLIPLWKQADTDGKRYLPHQYLYQLIRSGALKAETQADPKNAWLLEACKKDLPIFVPGWEDSTLGNIFTARVLDGTLSSTDPVLPGTEYMRSIAGWYRERAKDKRAPGFFQIGGGIAGDFPICVVPMLKYDLKENVPIWSYFCQISDSTTSYGSYSGAEPNEKITWGKLGPTPPRFVIESDATIVAPLIFAHVLDL